MIQTGSAMRTTIDDLTERVEFTYFDHKRDSSGNIVSISTKTHSRGTCWAKVLPIAANVGNGYESGQNAVGYRVTVRYRDDIMPDDLVVWRDKTLSITAPPYDAESRRKWTVLDCRELIPDGGQA